MIRITMFQDNPLILWIALKPGFPLSNNEEVWLKRECASETECRLLCELLQRKIGDNMTLVRKVSYFRGWKHAKAKKGGKRIWFPTAVSLLPWEKEEANV